ncbi:MAG: PadR family transcriptional regulator [Chloroflexota bacterium]
MPLEHAILSFIELEPMSGYDLKKFFDVSVTHFWSAAQSHIYKSLDGLEMKGWAESQIIQQIGKPNRKMYQITAAGKVELHRWLITPLPLEPVRKSTLIQIFFSHNNSNEEISNLITTRMNLIREQINTLKTIAQAAINENASRVGVERARQLWQITLDYGIDYYEFELTWHEKTLKTIRSLPPLGPPVELGNP